MDNIKDILLNIGYSNITDNITEFRVRPIYRDSDNNFSLKIDKNTGNWIDFGTHQHGTFNQLIQLSLGISQKDSLYYIQDINLSPRKSIELKKYIPKIFDSFELFIDNSYWNHRGISNETLEIFKGGISNGGKMNNRYVFPIYDLSNKIIGVSGRLIKDSDCLPKWKHIGYKNFWLYPTFINKNHIIESKEIILVESIGDCLSLFEMGITNVIVLFGLFMSRTMLCEILKYDLDRIIIALNNDFQNNNRGNDAAYKLRSKLLHHFDESQVVIKLPTEKDFNEMHLKNKESILLWKNI